MAIYSSMITGARRGEVLGLSFNDFNYERNNVCCNKNKISISGGTERPSMLESKVIKKFMGKMR